MEIIVKGLSEDKIQRDIKRMMSGWHLFFKEPTGACYNFIQPFVGYKWDMTTKSLKEIITKGSRVGDRNKHHLCIFQYNGVDKFVWCSWTKQVYDFSSKKYYNLEGNKLAQKITDLITSLV